MVKLRTEIDGLKEVQVLMKRLGKGAPAAVEQAVKDAGLAGQRALVRCYSARGQRSVADSVTSPQITKKGLDTESTIGVGHKWAELVEVGATIPVKARQAPLRSKKPHLAPLPGGPRVVKQVRVFSIPQKGGGVLFRASVGPTSYTLKGANCTDGAIEDGTRRMLKRLSDEVEKLTA